MSAIGRAAPESDAGNDAPDAGLLVNSFVADGTCVISVTGELDLATRHQLVTATTAGHHATTTIDLGGLTFMDCSGYGSLVDCRLLIEGDGRSLTITGQSGQPARLWELIAELERERCESN